MQQPHVPADAEGRRLPPHGLALQAQQQKGGDALAIRLLGQSEWELTASAHLEHEDDSGDDEAPGAEGLHSEGQQIK